jgi:hypothetical protein
MDHRVKPGGDEKRKAVVTMSRKPARKVSKRKDTDDDLTPKEWQARHDAACAIVARKYCDIFEFWRDCRYKPCRSARRCIGDARHCLDQRWASVPYDLGITADRRMSAETPPNADRFLWGAHQRAHHSVGKRNPKLPDNRNRREAGKETTTRETTTQATPQIEAQAKSQP